MGSRTGVGKSERTEAASPRGRASVSRVPPFSRAADYSPGLVFHAKRFIYSGISLKVSRCSPTLSQTKWRITTEAENSARGSAFVLLWRLSAADLQANLHNRPSFAQVGRLNISDITFEYISSAFGRHHDPRCPQRLGVISAEKPSPKQTQLG